MHLAIAKIPNIPAVGTSTFVVGKFVGAKATKISAGEDILRFHFANNFMSTKVACIRRCVIATFDATRDRRSRIFLRFPFGFCKHRVGESLVRCGLFMLPQFLQITVIMNFALAITNYT